MKFSVKNFSIIAFFLLASFNTVIAQNASDQRYDTLETFFVNQHAKGGYEVNGRTLNMPDDIVAKCEQKKIRVIGKTTSYKAIYDSIHEHDTSIVLQGKYESIPIGNDSGHITFKQRFVSTGSDFSIISIAVWSQSKKKWLLIYQTR